MSGELAERIRMSFANDHPASIVSNIKTTISDYFRQADPAISVQHTSYFNHSFAPDLVLTWPRENIDRYVYLRTNGDPAWLQEDLNTIGPRHPLMMTLAPALPDRPMHEVGVSAKQQNTLVTEPGVLEALTRARRRKSAAGLLGPALLQGGRGLIDEASVETAVDTTSVGFEGAQTVSKAPTQQAAAMLDDILDDRQSQRLTRILRFLWEGHGGAPSDFPVTNDVAAPLSGVDLRYLLEGIDSQDEQFWHRRGQNISLELLTQIPADDMPPSFQNLISANVANLVAKAIRVAHTEPRLGDPDDLFEWFISEGNLALRGKNFTAFIAASTVDSLPRLARRDGPSVLTLRQRAEEQELKLGVVRVTTGRATLTYESTVEVNLANDEDFISVSGALGPYSRVTEATVWLNGKRLICDFEESTAKGHTNAVFPVSDLVKVAIPLMQPLDEETRERLIELKSPEEEGEGGQLSLDLFGEDSASEDQEGI